MRCGNGAEWQKSFDPGNGNVDDEQEGGYGAIVRAIQQGSRYFKQRFVLIGLFELDRLLLGVGHTHTLNYALLLSAFTSCSSRLGDVRPLTSQSPYHDLYEDNTQAEAVHRMSSFHALRLDSRSAKYGDIPLFS